MIGKGKFRGKDAVLDLLLSRTDAMGFNSRHKVTKTVTDAGAQPHSIPSFLIR